MQNVTCQSVCCPFRMEGIMGAAYGNMHGFRTEAAQKMVRIPATVQQKAIIIPGTSGDKKSDGRLSGRKSLANSGLKGKL